MHRFLILAAGISVALASARAFAAVERTWTDYQGTTVKARFLTITDGLVRMRQGKKPIAIPFHQLCREDRKFIREEMREKGEENLVPTIGEPREWTAHGEAFEAEFVGPRKDDIILLRNDLPVVMPFASFSEEDQNYVRRQLTSKGQSHLIPKAASESGGEAGGGLAGGGPAGSGVPLGGGRSFGPSFGGSPFGSRHFGGTSGMHGTGPMGSMAGGVGGGGVPTYKPSGGAGAAGGYGPGGYGSGVGHAGGHAGGHRAAIHNPFGGSVPTYNPGASTHASAGSFGGSHDAGATFGGGSPNISIPEIPSFSPPELQIPHIKLYKYCKNCNAQYPIDATHCTACSGGFRWRRYGIFGAIIGGVVGLIGAVIKAIRS